MKYLVPYDFTPITRSALDHALSLCEHIPGSVELLHIVASQDKVANATSELEGVISSLGESHSDLVSANVRHGDIFKDIAKEAEEGDAQLLVMGTHGAKGLQKLFGSHAIKVITSSNTPFVVTQSKGPQGKVKLVVLPVDLSKESLQIVEFASKLAHQFNASIHLVCKAEKDEYLSNKLRNNINWAKMKMDKQITSEVISLEGKSSFAKEVIEYGEQNGASMFALTHFTESLIPQFDTFSQEMITNRLEVPVLIVSGRMTSNVKGNFIIDGI